MAARDKASLKNKRRHEINNVVLAGDKEKEAADRQKSCKWLQNIKDFFTQIFDCLCYKSTKFNDQILLVYRDETFFHKLVKSVSVNTIL